MRYLGGHLGTAVSALLDGQLDPPSAERAWNHVHGCGLCRRQVEREGWVKTQLAGMAGTTSPPDQLVGSLYRLSADRPATGAGHPDGVAAWAAVEEIERRGRGRRRAGIALVGAGSVSAAVLGFATLTGSTLGIGGTPATPQPSALTRSGTPLVTPTAFVGPVARVQGRLPSTAASVGAGVRGEGASDLRR